MIKEIEKIYKSFGKIEPDHWLDGRNFSDAFILCLASGPWRMARRLKIQQEAINKLNNQDLSQIEIDKGFDYYPEHTVINWFPLDWQNKYLYNMVKYLQDNELTMEEYCNGLIDGSPFAVNYYLHNREFLYQACENPKGIKVLSLFCRDSLKVPSFPIDRHVRRYLKEQGLPQTEAEIVNICLDIDIDPILLATAIVKNIGGVNNPDWSIKK